MSGHKERAHSKFSASGADRWINCPGSVAISEGIPSKDSIWTLEGTDAHEVLEGILRSAIEVGDLTPNWVHPVVRNTKPPAMIEHAQHAAKFIYGLYRDTDMSDIMVETKIYLGFIHPEMFGTFDGAVLDHFGTLHVFDYKYGKGHAVSPKNNLQMIFYGLGLAAKYDWNFKRVKLWIIQPRIKGYDGPLSWELSITELKAYADMFKRAVDRVEKTPYDFAEGSWCHWCKAKAVCPLKLKGRTEKAQALFSKTPIKR